MTNIVFLVIYVFIHVILSMTNLDVPSMLGSIDKEIPNYGKKTMYVLCWTVGVFVGHYYDPGAGSGGGRGIGMVSDIPYRT